MEHLLILFLVVLIASSIQSGTGFGFSILSMPFLLFLYNPHEAVLINISLSLLLSFYMAIKLRKSINKKLLLQLFKGSCIGFIPGLLLFIFLDVQPLKIIIGILILLISILLLFPFKINTSASKSITVGGLSGFLTTSIGIPGPPLLIYFSGAKIDKYTIRSTTLCFFIIVYSISLILHISIQDFQKKNLLDILFSIPIVSLGTIIGGWIFRKMNQKNFHRILYVIIAITGISLLLSSV